MIVDRVIGLAERGRIPDRWMERGMRRMMRRRLRRSAREAASGRQAAFIADCDRSEVAVEVDAANEQHYEVPAEFFVKILGPHLKYSSALFPTGSESIAEAEELMLALTCERAGLTDGMRVLELGCGWGSLTLWMARHFPRSRIVAVSNSSSQRVFIEQRCAALGLSNVEVHTADINDFTPTGRFDRVVSVEMFEHVRNHRRLLERIDSWLEPDGRLFVHIFCNRQYCYPFVDEGAGDWMARHFFTGGMMPSWDRLPDLGVLPLVERWELDGSNYGRTLRRWLERQDAARAEIIDLFGGVYGPETAVVWFNRWRMFHLACAELFEFDDGREWFVAHYLFAASGTR